MHSWFILAIVMALMVSPESLVILGNQMGVLGFGAFGSLLAAGLLGGLTLYHYRLLATRFAEPYDETMALRAAFGPVVAAGLPLCARVTFWVCGGTLTLATAGYVFNEIFVLWFPNLGFSFYLLGAILIINLIGQTAAEMLQRLCVLVAVAGLIVLMGVGLFSAPPDVASLNEGTGFTTSQMMQAWLIPLWLIVGFDLVQWTSREGSSRPFPTVMVGVGIVVGAVLLSLWGLTSLFYVPMDKLANTSVPHLTTARLAYGQTGRVMMGVIVLAGSTGAANALLLSVSRMLTRMAQHGDLPACLAWAPTRAPVALILLAIGPAAMMVTGHAGEPSTPVLVRASLIFWLLLHLAVQASVMKLTQRLRPQAHHATWLSWVGVIGISVYVIGLVAVEVERAQLLSALSILAIGAGVLLSLWFWVRGASGSVARG